MNAANQSAPVLDRRAWAELVLLSVLWGGSFFFIGAALRELPPLTVVTVRVALGAVTLLPFVRVLGGTLPKTPAGWLPFFVMGMLNNVIPFSLLVFGQMFLSSGLASVLNATTPLFTVLVLSAFGDERLTARRVIGVLIGLAGVVVLRGPGLQTGYNQTLGMLLCLAAAASYGFSGLWGRRKLAGIAPVTSAACQLVCSSFVMLIVTAAIERPWQLPMPGTATMLALIGLATLATALAYIVFFDILSRSGATNVMLVTLLIPVTAILLGTLVLGEPLTWREIAGAIIIGSALLVIDGRAIAWFGRRAPARV